MAEGIEVRHARSCASQSGKRCNCEPGYRVAAYDAISKRKVSKTFKTLGGARRWRAAAHTQAAKGVRLAGTAQILVDAAEAFVSGIASGAIRTRAGERYKPSVVREYERSLRLHVLPTLGGVKLSKLQRRDVQRLVDELLASGADPSTIRNALKPLQVIYRRAIEDGDIAINPCERLRLPSARGRRERIAPPAEAAALDRRGSPRGSSSVGLRVLCRPASRRASSSPLGRRRPRRRTDPRRAEHERPR